MDFLYKAIVMTICMDLGTPTQGARLPRLSLAEPSSQYNYFHNNIRGVPGVYSFSYDVSDDATGNNQYRSEDRYENGTVVGEYGYMDPFGTPQHFRYVADQAGYRVFRKNPSESTYGYKTTTAKTIDKIAQSTESSISWTRPWKRPNKNKNRKRIENKEGYRKNNQRENYNLVGSPSQYAYD